MESETFRFPCDAASIARLNALYGTDVELRNTVLDQADLPDASFDVAISVSVLEHVGEPELTNAIREAYRVLEPGGRLVMTVDLFLPAAPMAPAPRCKFGTNIDLKRLLAMAPFELEFGNRAELNGFDEFDPGEIMAKLDSYLIGQGYPALAQCIVLRKPDTRATEARSVSEATAGRVG